MRKIFTLRTLCCAFIFLLVCENAFSQTADFKVQHLQDDISNTGDTNTSFTSVSSLNNAVALANNNRKTHKGFDEDEEETEEELEQSIVNYLNSNCSKLFYF